MPIYELCSALSMVMFIGKFCKLDTNHNSLKRLNLSYLNWNYKIGSRKALFIFPLLETKKPSCTKLTIDITTYKFLITDLDGFGSF